jgi:hypothetical protein
VLLLVGATFSALLVPAFTQRWQDHQRALNVQTALVADTTEASETMLQRLFEVKFTARTNHIPGTPSFSDKLPLEQDQANREAVRAAETATQKWNVRAAVIGARLRAYYPAAAPVQDAWRKLMVEFEIIEISGRDLRLAQFDSRVLRRVNENVSSVVGRPTSVKDRDGYAIALYHLREKRDEILQEVLDRTPKT